MRDIESRDQTGPRKGNEHTHENLLTRIGKTRPPHAGTLYDESFDWGAGDKRRALATRAFEDPEIACVC